MFFYVLKLLHKRYPHTSNIYKFLACLNTSLATSVNKQCMVLLSDKVRLATEQDFDDFHICFDGFRRSEERRVGKEC